MCETHHIENIKEIQIDCDWTKSTRNSYFAFMEELHKLTQEHNMKLSSTIRLHQLSQVPPKADKGVLMVYNTGDFRDRNEEKPILDVDVVLKYADYLSDYNLPLATALPVFLGIFCSEAERNSSEFNIRKVTIRLSKVTQ